ncbi:hypothetical protein [Phnomibacter sp. MR]|uniref:hypothetical protein n=1 Tax=Phnomibacter sp. MR TaxID=3042318 RepID=UPI003A810E6C
MDSKLIKISSDTYKNHLKWPKVSEDSEWVYFGKGDDIDVKIVHDCLSAFVNEPKTYVAIDRSNSFECIGSKLPDTLKPLLGSTNFVLWNATFCKAIEFSDIGVFRIGEKAST